MVILFSTKCFLFVYMYIDLLKFKAYKLFENSDADLSWLLFQRSQLVQDGVNITFVLDSVPRFYVGNGYICIYINHRLLFHMTIVETIASGERGMNPVAMRIIKLRKEYWPSWGIEPMTSCFQVLYATDCATWARLRRREIYFRLAVDTRR